MRKLVIAVLFFPFSLFGQLDKIRVDMPEAEFMKTLPEAKRNYEAEAGWLNDSSATMNKLIGRARWKIERDTVVDYYFVTESVNGPSADYPKTDSSGVHEMKESAEILRRKIELAHGKPVRLINKSLTIDDPLSVGIVYLAEWVLSGNQNMRICITAPFETRNQINAPMSNSIDKKAESYELYVSVNARSTFTKMQFDIGKPVGDFLVVHPALKGQSTFTQYHVYTIPDSATCENAEWNFIFRTGVLTYFEYEAYIGTDWLAKSEEAAFDAARKKALQIFGDAKKVHGKPDSLVNNVPDKYVAAKNHLMYSEDHLFARWKSGTGVSECKFEQYGGGKHTSTVFLVKYKFEREK